MTEGLSNSTPIPFPVPIAVPIFESTNTNMKEESNVNGLMEVEVFRAGDYGPKGRYTVEDLDAMCADYDPSLHEAPVTVDHAQSGPAQGWTRAIARRGDVLIATLKDLGEAFQNMVREGAFKKRSVEIYRCFGETGRPYLRAVSFLGACPPEVKGLADPAFGESDDGERIVVEFADPNDDVAELSERKAALEAEIVAMSEQKRRGVIEAFCARSMDAGRLTPAHDRAGIVDFMMSLDDMVPLMGEDDENEGLTPLGWFKSFVGALPVAATMSEIAAEHSNGHASVECRLPEPGSTVPVSTQSVNLVREAMAMQSSQPGMSFAEALRRVSR